MNNTPFFEDESNITVNPNMKVYQNPFPEKMARAVAFFEKNGLPPDAKPTKKWKKKHKKQVLSTLQTELLTAYDFDPSEQQMAQLKDFLAQLFGDKLIELKAKQEEKLTV
jgi:hypothetical protein